MTGAGLVLATRAHGAPTSTALDLFSYADVELADSLARQQRDQTHATLMALDLDRALRPYRLRSGQPAPGEELGGWYSTWAFAPGHAFGQWMSALSRYAAATNDESSRRAVARWIEGYAQTVAGGRFYEENRFPSYTFDKLVCGLVDAHRLAGNRDALAVLARTTDAAQPYLPAHAIARRETPVLHHEDFTEHCWDESYTLPENLFRAYEVTGEARYLDLAKRFLFGEFFEPLARGENVLPGRHAYSHVNALGSATKAYLVLGQRSYLNAAEEGFRFLSEQSFATGGWGPDEHFVEPHSGKLGEGIASEHHSFETPCGAYAHFKLTRSLLQITRDPKYGDSMERVLYNCALGALPLQSSGRAFYYSDYTPGASKGFHPDAWPCCSGTLPQLAADYGISSYLRDREDVYVNLYLPSTVRWQSGGARFSLSQDGDYPYSDTVSFRIKASSPQVFAIKLRIPAWVAKAATIRIAGEPPREAMPGSFASIRREWKDGDRFELELPMSTRLEPVDRFHPRLNAVVHGPLVFFLAEPPSAPFEAREVLQAARNGASEMVVANRQRARLRPWTAIAADQPYSTYVDVAS